MSGPGGKHTQHHAPMSPSPAGARSTHAARGGAQRPRDAPLMGHQMAHLCTWDQHRGQGFQENTTAYTAAWTRRDRKTWLSTERRRRRDKDPNTVR